MNKWKNVFALSPIYQGRYDESALPHCRWEWPVNTWLQARRQLLGHGSTRAAARREPLELGGLGSHRASGEKNWNLKEQETV